MRYRGDAALAPGPSHQITLSRRASDAIRARAAELSRAPVAFAEVVVKAGLEALAPVTPRPVRGLTEDRDSTEDLDKERSEP